MPNTESDNQVIVGNIGTVYEGNDEAEAYRAFCLYRDKSKAGEGRAADEDVTWMRHNEPHMEHTGKDVDSLC
jgi:hypothetical protein